MNFVKMQQTPSARESQGANVLLTEMKLEQVNMSSCLRAQSIAEEHRSMYMLSET